jgi:hypothetical protein
VLREDHGIELTTHAPAQIWIRPRQPGGGLGGINQETITPGVLAFAYVARRSQGTHR